MGGYKLWIPFSITSVATKPNILVVASTNWKITEISDNCLVSDPTVHKNAHTLMHCRYSQNAL